MKILTKDTNGKEINLRFIRFGDNFDLEICTQNSVFVCSLLRINRDGYLQLVDNVKDKLIANDMDFSELQFDEKGAIKII